MRPGADPGPPPAPGRPSVTGPDGLNSPASAGRGTATVWLVTRWRGWRARASALARTTSGSRGSGGRASRQERSRRALGLWIRICFTVISSAMSGPGSREDPAVFADRSRGRYGPAPPWGVTRRCASGWNLPRPAARHDSAAGSAPGHGGAARGTGCGVALGDQAELARAGDGLGAVGRAELAQEVAEVLFHGVEADYRLRGDARVRRARGQQRQDFQLAGGQMLGQARHHHGVAPGPMRVVLAAGRLQ